MNFKLNPLPYDSDALAPFLSAQTLETHHEKHHAGYLAKLDAALEGEDRNGDLLALVRRLDGHLFNLAAQVWNHDFYWQSLRPDRTLPEEEGALLSLVNRSFGSFRALEDALAEKARGVFGSGWAWLSFDPGSGSLVVEGTSNAGNPATEGRVPLLTLDVWEHAYYLDYQQDRGAYVSEFIDGHANWRFAEANLEAVLAGA